jgi:hypothetical protein
MVQTNGRKRSVPMPLTTLIANEWCMWSLGCSCILREEQTSSCPNDTSRNGSELLFRFCESSRKPNSSTQTVIEKGRLYCFDFFIHESSHLLVPVGTFFKKTTTYFTSELTGVWNRLFIPNCSTRWELKATVEASTRSLSNSTRMI